jgi:hypothetical protein
VFKLRIRFFWSGVAIACALGGHPNVCRSQSTTHRVQNPPKRISGGRVTGIVFDSLHAVPLENAEILVEGRAVRVTHTDAAGRFSTDVLPAGKYKVAVSHPSLDSIAIALTTPEFLVVPDSVIFVQLGVPSAEGLIKIKCAGRSHTSGNSAIIGRIESAESQSPMANIELALTWTTYEVSKVGGVEQTPHIERDTTKANGGYLFCGLPTALHAKLEARVAGELRSASTVTIPDSGTALAVKNFVVPLTRLPDQQIGLVSGRVILPSGQPARGSVVEIVRTGQKTRADDRGTFVLDSIPIGSQTIRVRQLGFEEESLALDVGPSFGQGLVVKLKETVPVLTAVRVSATPIDEALDRVGFSQRSQHSVGHFLTREEIARKSDFQFTDLLRGIPGLTVGIDKYGDDVISSGRAGGSILNSTHGCVQYFVDGQPWGNGALESMGGGRPQDSAANKMLARLAIETAREINAVLTKSQILGIEVYQGGGAPAYFNQGGHNCATIVVWTIASLNR